MGAKLSRATRQRLRVIIIGTTLLLVLWLTFSPFGVMKYLRLKKEIARADVQIQQLQEENRKLEEEIDRLRNDPRYLEEIARKQFGLVKKNEIILDFGKKGSSNR